MRVELWIAAGAGPSCGVWEMPMNEPQMQGLSGFSRPLVLTCLVLWGVAALGYGSATTAPASLPWEDAGKRVKVRYPADWQSRSNPDYELMLIPAAASNEKRRITFDVPDLPPHLAFMIQMSRVERGYIEDLKKEHPDLQVNDASDAHVADCKARLIRSTWHQDKQTFDDVALLMIHDGDVYILDLQTDDPNLPATRLAFDSIESSLAWTKR